MLYIDDYGTEEWLLNGERHRTDGPAVIFPDGTEHWYLNDKLHREDGPAIIWAPGSEEWWINGERLNDFQIARQIILANKDVEYG
jgi:hypothetical protein